MTFEEYKAKVLADLDEKEKLADLIEDLRDAGIPVEWERKGVWIEQETLPLLRQMCGEIKHEKTDAWNRNEVWVQVSVATLPGWTFNYTRPYEGDGKCRIVPCTITSYTMVCDR